MKIKYALMAESVDASDLKSDMTHLMCQFKSGLGHFKASFYKRLFFALVRFWLNNYNIYRILGEKHDCSFNKMRHNRI